MGKPIKIIRKVEDIATKTIQKETYRKKKNTEKTKDQWGGDNFKWPDMHIIRVPKKWGAGRRNIWKTNEGIP